MPKVYDNTHPNIPQFDISAPTPKPKTALVDECGYTKEVWLKLICDDDSDWQQELVLRPAVRSCTSASGGFCYHPVINGHAQNALELNAPVRKRRGRGSGRPKVIYRIIESILVVGGKLTLHTGDDGFGAPRTERYRILDFELR